MADGPNRPNRPIRPRGGGAGGRRRRVVIEGGNARGRDARAARDRSQQAPPRQQAPAPHRPGHRRVRRHGQGPVGCARRPDVPDHQDPDGARSDAHRDAVALGRRGRADCGRGRPRGHRQARRRRRGARDRRRRRGGLERAASGRHDHGPRRPRQDDAARRDCAPRPSSTPRPAGSRSTSVRTRPTSTGESSRSSTLRATRRSPRCAPAARR